MILHRAICHTNEPQIHSLGVYWSRSPQKAYPYGCKGLIKYYWLYTAEIEAKFVDKDRTLYANLNWPDEKEVCIKPGSLVKVLKIRKYSKPDQQLLETFNLKYNTTT